ncbi:MAG TPA: hypothetical protein VIQ31_39650, partial [Phormidium sp.]
LWHINKNILSKTKGLFTNTAHSYDTFIADVNSVFYKKTVEEFEVSWDNFCEKYNGHAALTYVRETWFQHRQKFVQAWTKDYLHLGSQVTSRVESSHAIMKQYVQNSTGDLLVVVQRLDCFSPISTTHLKKNS